MLKAYHGGFKRNLRLFIRERPLSFNHRDDENALNYLRSILRARSQLGDNPISYVGRIAHRAGPTWMLKLKKAIPYVG